MRKENVVREEAPAETTTVSGDFSVQVANGINEVAFSMKNGIPYVKIRVVTEDKIFKLRLDDSIYGRFWVLWSYYELAKNVFLGLPSKLTQAQCESLFDILSGILLGMPVFEARRKMVGEGIELEHESELVFMAQVKFPDSENVQVEKLLRTYRTAGRLLDMAGFPELFGMQFYLFKEDQIRELHQIVGIE